MARRVGFGDRARGRRADDAPREAPGGDAAATGDPAEPRGRRAAAGRRRRRFKAPASPAARIVASLFIAVWLAGWSYGIVFAWRAFRSSLESGDWYGIGFLAIWLTFAAIGWAIGVVILVVILFGKPRSPEQAAALAARPPGRRTASRE